MSLVKNIFGKSNFFAHISLFSLSGIMAILFSNAVGIYSDTLYFGFPPVDNLELAADVLVSVLIFAMLIGYNYDFAHALFEDENYNMPEIKLNSIVTFFKMFPVFVAWITYLIILQILGMKIFPLLNIFSYAYYAVLWCCLPFIAMLLVLYSRNFDLKCSIFNPVPLFKIIKNCFGAFIIFMLKTIIPIVLIGFILIKCFVYTKYLANYPPIQLGLRLFLLSLSAYLTAVVSLIYTCGYTEILKEKGLIE